MTFGHKTWRKLTVFISNLKFKLQKLLKSYLGVFTQTVYLMLLRLRDNINELQLYILILEAEKA